MKKLALTFAVIISSKAFSNSEMNKADKGFDIRHRQQLDLQVIRQGLSLYFQYHDELPSNEQGLNALIESPKEIKKWKGPFVQGRLLTDKWHTPIKYFNHGYEAVVLSAGPDRKFGSNDDIVSYGYSKPKIK